MMSTTVLLVEDDPDDLELFLTFFSDRKDLVLLPPAGNGLELVERLESISQDADLPNLIVLDHNMPLMNGKQTLKFLRDHDRFRKIPTVIYSTYTDTTLVADCKKLGARLVASKPVDMDGYNKMMADFLDII